MITYTVIKPRLLLDIGSNKPEDRDQICPWKIIYYSWIKREQLDVTCFIISLFTAQHVLDVNTSILGSLRLIWWVINGLYCSGSMCVGVTLWFGWGGVVSVCRLKHYSPAYGYYTTTTQHEHTSNQNHTTHAVTYQIGRKLLRMDVLTSETCRALNNEIIKQVTSSWFIFIQLSRWCTVQ